MTDEIQKAIDISNLSDEQIFELYSDVIEWGEGDLLAECYCSYYDSSTGTSVYYILYDCYKNYDLGNIHCEAKN